MSTPLHDWKEALEDLGVMGLIPATAPEHPVIEPSSLTVASQTQKPPEKTMAVAVAPKPIALVAAEPAWEAPDDPAKNPSPQYIMDCKSLDELCSCICRCEACPLGAGRIKFVFGEGSPNAEMMFIGEGPGRDEDIQGRPFVGRAGDLLNKMIGALKMERGDVYIANVVKCRPPDNRTPSRIESQTCLRYLARQIELVKPKVLVGLGATPLREFVGNATGITKIRGTWHTCNVADREIPFMPTFHPAYVLRSYTKEVRQAVWNDLLAAQKKIEELRASPAETPE
jgi:DNA polymerase